MDDSPIPDGLDPTSVLEFIKGAFENMGYLGRLIKIRAYCEDRSKLISYCDAAGILSQNRVSKVGYAEVDHMLVDILTWGLYNRAPSNLMVISEKISEGTELFGVLEDLKLLNYNTLVSSLGEDAPADLVCLSTRLFGGGKPVVHQSISSHGVFWNLDDCETPDDTDIYQNVKSALANQGCHGQVSIWAYCEEDKEPIPGITLVSAGEFPLGDETARFKKMLRDILFWALQNPVHHRRTTVPSLTVISNISRNIEFAHVLQLLASRDYNVLLTVPDKKEYICSVWLYPCLIQSQIKFPSCTRLDKSLHDIKTGIFWNITGCTFPNDIHLDELNQNIKLSIENQGHHGEVTIKAYWEGRMSGDPDMKLNTILLQDLESKGYNIFVAHVEEAGSPVIPPACLEWRLDTLLAGGNPINRTNYSRDVLNMIQNDLSFRRKDCDEANTAVFWDIEDCPIPGGMDPLTFLQNIKLALVNHGCHVNVSIMAYCDKNRSLEDFSLSDTSPITLVPTGDKYARIKKMFRDIFLWAMANPQTSSVMVVITKSMPWHISDVPCDAFESRNYNLVLADPYAVGYVNSVWLSTSLFGGGNPIDLKERKDHRSPIML
ncbi:hypothetical protein Bca52824_047263 [Brassica carinata]|uniref:NYN domain-containing protein n=1 Tax=Brassica carinata TaxID=52824 RepID=A0A8X7REH0_BRACI|nr:hypothetical protein Bca52824_047263 [Brassica carinata]